MKDNDENDDAYADDTSEHHLSIEDLVSEALRAESTNMDTFSEASVHTAYQKEIALLNHQEDENWETTATAIAIPDAAPQGLTHEKAQSLLASFEVESLQKLQFLGLSPEEESALSILENLCVGMPVKFRYQPRELSYPLILLVKPDLSLQHLIHLTVMPYLKISHPLTTH